MGTGVDLPSPRSAQTGSRRACEADRVHRADPRPVLGRTFDAVLFDMDGTLISSTASVVRSWTQLAVEYAIPAERFGDFHGIPARALIDLLLADRTADERDAAEARITELEIADGRGVVALPGAAEAMAALAPAGRCAVVTSANARLATARLTAAGLLQCPVVTADDVARGKPDPEPFRAAAAVLGVDPARTLVVEDASAGVTAGRAAGATVLGVRTTSRELAADLVVDDLAAVRLVPVLGGVEVRDGGVEAREAGLAGRDAGVETGPRTSRHG